MFTSWRSNKNAHEYFWRWFVKNSASYFRFEQNQEFLFRQLKTELNRIHPDLVFEFSPILQDGKREFVISADGIKSVFPIVRELTQKAPILNCWHIVPFRQPRKEITQVAYGDLVVNISDVFFDFKQDKGQIAIELNIKNYYESAEWTGFTFILLDNILGEYHTEMSLSTIETKALDEQNLSHLYPITDLPKIVHTYYADVGN